MGFVCGGCEIPGIRVDRTFGSQGPSRSAGQLWEDSSVLEPEQAALSPTPGVITCPESAKTSGTNAKWKHGTVLMSHKCCTTCMTGVVSTSSKPHAQLWLCTCSDLPSPKNRPFLLEGPVARLGRQVALRPQPSVSESQGLQGPDPQGRGRGRCPEGMPRSGGGDSGA